MARPAFFRYFLKASSVIGEPNKPGLTSFHPTEGIMHAYVMWSCLVTAATRNQQVTFHYGENSFDHWFWFMLWGSSALYWPLYAVILMVAASIPRIFIFRDEDAMIIIIVMKVWERNVCSMVRNFIISSDNDCYQFYAVSSGNWEYYCERYQVGFSGTGSIIFIWLSTH